MTKKAKRLVSESLHRRRLLHIALFRRALAHFPQSPDHRPSIAAILFVLCEASSEGAGHILRPGAQAVISQRSISLEVDHACIID